MYEELVKRLRDGSEYINSNYIVLAMLQAADAIEDLQKQVEDYACRLEEYAIDKHCDDIISRMDKLIKGLDDKHRWIPVTERLPEEMDQSRGEWSAEIRPSDDVLVWLSHEKRQSVAWYSHPYKEWTTVDENTVYCFEEVTYWQPLPRPPKEET